MSFLITLDVCSQKSSGHKAVKFGRNTYLNWDYSLTKNIQFWGGQVGNISFLCWFVVEWPNSSITISKTKFAYKCILAVLMCKCERYLINTFAQHKTTTPTEYNNQVTNKHVTVALAQYTTLAFNKPLFVYRIIFTWNDLQNMLPQSGNYVVGCP
jgi:hypothetical protein